MAADYLEQLDDVSLGWLAEAAGVASAHDAPTFFAERPHAIRVALASAGAADGPCDQAVTDRTQRGLLRVATAVHRTAEELSLAGWTTRDDETVDISLVRFAGQGEHLAFMIHVLASYLPSPWLDPDLAPPAPATITRIERLLELHDTVAETERAGVLRLLGDEALFATSFLAAELNSQKIDQDLIERLQDVLPGAVRGLRVELGPQLRTLLDAYLLFGPIWYQMASQNLLHRSMRAPLAALASEFTNARRFLVRVAQGPMNPLRHGVFTTQAATVC